MKGLTSKELISIIQAMGGKQQLADLLPVTVRTLDRWLAGQRSIHPAMVARIRSVASQGKKK